MTSIIRDGKSCERSEKKNELILAGECCSVSSATRQWTRSIMPANCHCSNCRRMTGSAFKLFAGIARHKFNVVKGDHNLMIFGDESGHDARCPPLLADRIPAVSAAVGADGWSAHGKT